MRHTLLKTFRHGLLAVCFSMPLLAYAAPEKDPLKPYNKAMFHFNDALDHLLLKPIAQAYLNITPKPITNRVSNFYDNLSTLPTIGNDLLQADFRQATSDTWRFLINTTVGLLGLFDVASSIGLPEHSEDMGLTFAEWGWTQSTYVVLPLFGPSTVRDALGKPIDQLMSVYPYIRNVPLRNSLYAMSIVNLRANLLELQGVINQASLDPYVFQRNAYLQRRAYLIKQNIPGAKECADNTNPEDKTKIHVNNCTAGTRNPT